MTFPLDSKPPAAKSARLWDRWPGQVARWVLGVAPFIWLAGRVNFAHVWQNLLGIDRRYLLSAFVAFGLSVVSGAARWRVLLQAFGGRSVPPLGTLFVHNLVGIYFNVLPSGFVGDAVRGYRVRQVVDDLATSYTIVVIERLSGLLGLLLIALIPALAQPELRSGTMGLARDVALAVGVAAALVGLMLPRELAVRPNLRAQLARIPIAGPLMLRLKPMPDLSRLVSATFFSVCAQVFAVLGVVLLAQPLAPQASPLAVASVTPMAVLLTYVPITPAALGQREAVFVYVLGLAGVPGEAAITTSLLMFALSMGYAAVGAGFYFAERISGARGNLAP
jgi:hypothetical protein